MRYYLVKTALVILFIMSCSLITLFSMPATAAGCDTSWGKFIVTKDTDAKITILKKNENVYKKENNKMVKQKDILKVKNSMLVNDTEKIKGAYYYLLADGTYLEKSSNIKYEEVPYEQLECAENVYYNSIINDIANKAKQEKTNVEKILYVYNALGRHIEYEDRGLNYSASHTARGAILNGKAYCDGYSESLIAVLAKLKINAQEVVSWDMNHSWIMVKLDGHYYHLDLTWDDLDKNVSYKYFLLSDKEIIKKKHYGWEPDNSSESLFKAKNDKYLYLQNLFTHENGDSNLFFQNGYFYFLDRGESLDDEKRGIYKLSFDQKVKQEIPHTKFNEVEYFNGWYYGINDNYEEKIVSLYKFSLGGEEIKLFSVNDAYLNLFIKEGYVEVSYYNELNPQTGNWEEKDSKKIPIKF